jgi:hypothetical protein
MHINLQLPGGTGSRAAPDPLTLLNGKAKMKAASCLRW